jgi:hypothetical protein
MSGAGPLDDDSSEHVSRVYYSWAYAHICIPGYLGGRDPEYGSLRPAGNKSEIPSPSVIWGGLRGRVPA